MRGRRIAAAIVALGLAGCSLISGASDLEIGPTTTPVLAEASGEDAGDASADRAGPTDGALPDGAALTDAATDGGPSRLRDITFESGSLTGPAGADRVQGGVVLQGAGALAGNASAAITRGPGLIPAVIGVDLMPFEPELWLSVLFRLQSDEEALAVMLSVSGVTPAMTSTTVTVGLVGTKKLVLKVGTATLGTSADVQKGTVYRLGLRVRAGEGNGLVEASLGPAAAGDVVFASSATQTLGRTSTVDLGQLDNLELEARVDNLRIDRSGLPPP